MDGLYVSEAQDAPGPTWEPAPRSRIGAMAAIVAVGLFVVACSTPTNRWAAARVTLTSVQRAILVGHQANVLGDEVLVGADPYVRSARAALDAAEKHLPEGGDVYDELMDMAEAAIASLEAMADPAR